MVYTLELWLARSGVLPLEVIIDAVESGRRTYRGACQDDIKRIMDMVNAQAQRVVVLRAKAEHSWLQHLDFETLGAKNLHRVEIAVPAADADDPSTQEGDADLERIRIGPLTEPTALMLECWTIPQLGVGTDRLTHVVLAHLETKDVLDVLESAPRLVSCSVSNCIAPRDSQVPNAVVHHSNLRALDIRTSTSASSFILESVCLPRLDSFRIHEVIGIRPVQQFLQLLRRSSNPPLRVLHFEEVTLRQKGLERRIAAIVRCVASTLQDFVFRLSRSIYSAPVDVMRSHELVDAVFGASVELPLLSSVALYGIEYRWSHTLLYLAKLLSTSRHPWPLKVKLYILNSSQNAATVEGVLASSCFDQTNSYPVKQYLRHTNVADELPAISTAEILEMLALIDRHSLSFAVYIDFHMSEDVDIFPELRTRLLDICNS